MQRLREVYESKAKDALSEKFSIKNTMALPRLRKIVVNVGVGSLMKNKEGTEALKRDLAAITGQAAAVKNAKISVAGFGIRQGMPVGLTATLRGERMYSFFDRFVSIVLPRLRDFRGVSTKSFDQNGNYTIGLSEHVVFPEIDVAKSAQPHGLEITFVINSNSKEKSLELLTILGMPFEKS